MNITFNGIVLNNIRTDLGVIRVVGLSLPTAPDITNYFSGSGHGTGVYDFGKKFNAKVIGITFGFSSSTFENLQLLMGELTKTLLTEKVQKLQFSHIPSKYYMARISKIGTPTQEQLLSNIIVEFTAPLPFMVGDEITSTLVADAKTITLLGDVPTKPIITATFTGATTSYRVNIGSKYLLISDSFLIGDVLELDSLTGAVRKNGVRIQDKLDWTNSTPSAEFTLELGSNSITVTPTAKANTTLRYRERFY